MGRRNRVASLLDHVLLVATTGAWVAGPEAGHRQHLSLLAHSVASSVSSSLAVAGDPTTLADYCKGGPAPLAKEQRVEANWGGYGSYYPGKITEVNDDKTVDVLYDDGWEEENLDPASIKVIDGKKTQGEKPKFDAACEVADKVLELKKRIQVAEKDVGLWLKSKKAEGNVKLPKSLIPQAAAAPAPAGSPSPATAPPAPAAAPAAAPVDPKKNAELEELKRELGDVDAAIRELQQEVDGNDKLLRGGLEDDSTLDQNKALTIDDLIIKYRERIAERKKELQRLKARREQQKAQLARIGIAPVSLNKIQEDVKGISDDIGKLKLKRAELEDQGRLDPELRVSLERLIEQGNALDMKVANLVEAEQRAVAQKAAAMEAARKAKEDQLKELEAAEEERRTAAENLRRMVANAKGQKEALEAARAQAEAEAEAARKATTEALKIRNLAAAAQAAAAAAAQEDLIKAAEGVEEGLKSVGKETQHLDTGVHPHGEKWWRFRYEHSFVEGFLMMFLTILMLWWETFVKRLRIWIVRLSHSKHAKEADMLATGTMYLHWLEYFLGEMVACLLVFLTIWILGHTGVFDLFPLVLHSTDSLHFPATGFEYKVIAADMCVVLIFSILFYFTLTFSIVRAATQKMFRWAKLENQDQEQTDDSAPATPHSGGEFKREITVARSLQDYAKLKRHFMNEVVMKDPEAIDLATFSFWKYLRINVRDNIDTLFMFGPFIWIPIILTFVVLCFLHGWGKMGYIRIMAFFLLVLCTLLSFMTWVILSINRESATVMASSSLSARMSRRASFHAQAATKTVIQSSKSKMMVSFMMHYSVFFLCYGAARTICQSWMWELHFYPLLGVTALTILISLVFVIWIAPMVPTYAASLALPPYVDIENVKAIKERMQEDTVTAAEYAKN